MKNGTIISILIIIAIIIIGAAVYLFIAPTPKAHNSQESEQVVLVGKVTCLPHKGSGPHTLECALGLESNGKNYALVNVPSSDRELLFQTGNEIKVEGTLTAPDPDTTYDIVGKIDVVSLSSVEGDKNASRTKSYANENPDFSFEYPDNWQFGTGVPKGRMAMYWSEFSEIDGKTYTTVYSSQEFFDGTNVDEVQFHVGSSNDAQAVSSCTKIPENHTPDATKKRVTINGTEFTKVSMTAAGAGNRYETVSYRTVRDGVCYAVEYTVHFSPVEFYDKDMHIADGVPEARAHAEKIAQSFEFGS